MTDGGGLSPRAVRTLGWIATLTAVAMYLSYLDQIQLNLAGDKGSKVQPAAAIVNCTLWVLYGAWGPRRDWPIILANAPGVILGAVALATAF